MAPAFEAADRPLPPALFRSRVEPADPRENVDRAHIMLRRERRLSRLDDPIHKLAPILRHERRRIALAAGETYVNFKLPVPAVGLTLRSLRQYVVHKLHRTSNALGDSPGGEPSLLADTERGGSR